MTRRSTLALLSLQQQTSRCSTLALELHMSRNSSTLAVLPLDLAKHAREQHMTRRSTHAVLPLEQRMPSRSTLALRSARGSST